MTDQSNVPDTYGGGSHKRRTPFPMPAEVRVPTFADERDASVIADSDKVVDELKTTLGRHVAAVNKPSDQPKAAMTTPLKEIAQRIKKLVHDDGEAFGNELDAKMKAATGDKPVSTAKALQLWADETLKIDQG
jgi:hypothetical protein